MTGKVNCRACGRGCPDDAKAIACAGEDAQVMRMLQMVIGKKARLYPLPGSVTDRIYAITKFTPVRFDLKSGKPQFQLTLRRLNKTGVTIELCVSYDYPMKFIGNLRRFLDAKEQLSGMHGEGKSREEVFVSPIVS